MVENNWRECNTAHNNWRCIRNPKELLALIVSGCGLLGLLGIGYGRRQREG